MDINGVSYPADFLKKIDNGDAKITKTEVFDPQKVGSPEESVIPSVIRHTADDTPPSNGLKNGGIAEMYRYISSLGRTETRSERWQREAEVFDILYRQMPAIAADMRRSLDQFIEKSSKEAPDLVNSNWGFSINSDGNLSVIGKLNKNDKTNLNRLLNESGELQKLSRDFSGLLIKTLELDRGPAKRSSTIGKFDLTAENFSEIIDLKNYLDSPFQGGSTSYLADKNDVKSLYLNQSILNLGEQLASKAEIKYDKGIVDKYDFDTGEWHRIHGFKE